MPKSNHHLPKNDKPAEPLCRTLSALAPFRMDRAGNARTFVPTPEPENAAPDPEMLHPPELPPATAMSLLGVDYFRVKTEDGGDLYLTHFGAPFWRHLMPEN